MLPRALGYTPPPSSPAQRWIAPVFGTAVFLYGGLVFLQGAWRELRDRLPGMMTLIALAIIGRVRLQRGRHAGLSRACRCGRSWRRWSRSCSWATGSRCGRSPRPRGRSSELAKLLPNTALRVRDGEVRGGADRRAARGRPGAGAPRREHPGRRRWSWRATSEVNESMITGESRPVKKAPGDEVIAGTVNGAGSLRVAVTGTGEQTALAGIMRLVEQAQTSRSRAQALADRAAFWLTIVAIVAGAVTFVAWLALRGDPAFAVERLVTVLVIACPHALGLAVPLVIAISTTLGARSGLLVRDRRGLEEARNLTAMVFDKTGTLTRGEFGVVGIATPRRASTEQEALRLAAAVERDSEHTIAQGIVRRAEERGIVAAAGHGFRAIPGRGGQRAGRRSGPARGGPGAAQGALGRRSRCPAAQPWTRRPSAGRPPSSWSRRRAGARACSAGGVHRGRRDTAGVREAVQELHEQRIKVVMLTGDARPVAEAVARELGIDTVFAEVLPRGEGRQDSGAAAGRGAGRHGG